MDAPIRSANTFGWPFPWWGLLGGGVFLGAMFTPLGGIMGVVAGFGLAMLSAPVLMIAAAIGAGDAAPMAATIFLGFLVLLGIGKLVMDIVRAPDRRSRSLLMNRLTLFVLLTAGLVVSLFALQDAWRY